jgi:hypothetical protein
MASFIRRLMFALIVLLSHLSFSQTAPQRIAILKTSGPTSITHGGSGSGRFPSFCADGSEFSSRRPPGYGESYNYLLPGNQAQVKIFNSNGTTSTMPLTEALSGLEPILKGSSTDDRSLKGSYKQFIISLNPARTDVARVEVQEISSPLIFAQSPDDTKDLLAHQIVKVFGADQTQDDFWAASDILVAAHKKLSLKTRLAPLVNLNDASVAKLRTLLDQPDFKALPLYIQAELLTSSDVVLNDAGQFTESTIRYLRIVKKFSDWGLWRSSDSFRWSVAQFQDHYGLPVTYSITPEVKVKMKQIEAMENAAVDHRVSPASVYQLFKRKLIGLENGGSLTALSPQWLEATRRVEKFLLDFQHTFYDDLKGFQKQSKLKETGVPDKETLQFLDKKLELLSLIEAWGPGNDLSEIMCQHRGRYIIVQDGTTYLYNRANEFHCVAGPNEIEELEQEFRDDIVSATRYTADVTFVSLGSRYKNQLKIQFGDVVSTVTWDDTNDLSALKTAFRELLLTRPKEQPVIIARDFLAKGKIGDSDDTGSTLLSKTYVQDRQWLNQTEFLKELRNEFPERQFYLGSNLWQDYESVKSAPRIKTGADMVAYIAPQSLQLHYESVKKMKSSLTSAAINVHDLDDDFSNIPDEFMKSNVLILSGHKDNNYVAYLKKLADNGLLADKVVVVFSCNEKGTTNLNSYLMSKGAQKVIFFPTRLNVSATNAVIKELAALAKKITEEDGILLEDLMRKAVENAESNPDNEELKDEIRVLKNFINQTSFNFDEKAKCIVYG